MKPRAFLIHGFNVDDGGAGTTDRLRPYFESNGYEVVEQDYGWRGLLGVRLHNDRSAARLVAEAMPGDIAVGHSNGAAIIHAATHAGARLTGVVYINPALDRDLAPGPSVLWADVYYSPSDKVVPWARLLIGHAWGDMGRTGYRGNDKRVRSWNLETAFGRMPTAIGHSTIFRDDLIDFFGPTIAFRAWMASKLYGGDQC